MDSEAETSAERAAPAGSFPLPLIVLFFFLAFGLVFLLLFLPAGRLDWWQGWLYFGLLLACSVAMSVGVHRSNPELFRRRARIGRGTKGWDIAILQAVKVLYLGGIILAALDAGRFGWTTVPTWATAIAAAVHTAGFAILGRAMRENTHFESTVRIQTDRAHTVVDTGPYAVVRHPGYSGFLLMIGATAPLLGSLWALLPMAGTAAVIVLRTALEDRTLTRELPGYAEYRERIRRRLVPRLW